MQFVNKQNGFIVALHFLNDAFEAIFYLALVGRSGHQCSQIELEQHGRGQVPRHALRNNVLGEAVDQRGFAHARLADDKHVGLGAPPQNLHHHPRLTIAPDNGIGFALPGQRGAVHAVLEQRFALRGSRLLR